MCGAVRRGFSQPGHGKKHMAPPRSPFLLRVTLVVAVFLQVGCSASAGSGPRNAEGGPMQKDTRVVHEDCDAATKGEKLDVNNDGKPDISIEKSGGREVCRAVDLDFDGAIDAWSYNDGNGQLRRREADFDRDGRLDEIQIYKSGSLVEKQRATTLNGHLDTWHFYTGGRLARTERDADGDGTIDQWWEYPAGASADCPVIHTDGDGDGRPDPGSTVDVCKQPGSGYVPPERQGPANTGPSFKPSDTGETPTELENKEGPEGGEKKEGDDAKEGGDKPKGGGP